MSYRDLFSSINCQRVIFFEDGFEQTTFQKTRALYDLVRMDLNDRALYLSDVKAQFPELESKICAFLKSIDKYFDAIAWQDTVIFGDITSVFPQVPSLSSEDCAKLIELYTMIDDNDIASVYSIGAKYGIGISYPAQYESIFYDYILLENRAKSFRVYQDYSAATAELFSKDISCSTNSDCVVCIIDNQLGEVKRASEIIQAIKVSCKPMRKNIVGCVFSSQGLYEEIDTDVYFEYASKSNVENLEACLARSAYNYYLSKLKEETLKNLSSAFELAQKSKGIAYYLSRKAQREGESEYQIINDWLQLLTMNSQAESGNIKHLISLSRVINSLEDTMDIPDVSLQKLNTLEAFDFRINEYYLPVAAGDIFTDDKNNWYVLVGQDCDMARSSSRNPKNALAELLPAEVRPQADFKKWATDLKKVAIYNFRKSISENSEILQVDYTQREFLANEILNLCSYNADGSCKISLTQKLTSEQTQLLPQYMVEYYATMQKYFASIKEIRSLARDAFGFINAPEQTRRLISISDFEESTGQIVFGLRRVCRLTHIYVFYLYKLYLEYRGRQPFQTINLVREDEVSLPVYAGKRNKTDHLCTVRRFENPNESNSKKWHWIIKKAELTRILNLLQIEVPDFSHVEEDISLGEEISRFPLPGKKELVIEKAKDKIKLYTT